MKDETLLSVSASLFSRPFYEKRTDAERTATLNQVDSLIDTYSWKSVFDAWNNYLHTHCTTPEAVINYANWFFAFGGHERPIHNPHQFLAYFYYRIDYNVQKYDIHNILDSLATSILPKAGYREADLYLHPYYMPENDPKIRAEVEKLKQNV